MKKLLPKILLTSALLLTMAGALHAQTVSNLAPGAPGQDAHWPSAAKDGLGTANTLDSKVWFTLRAGVMTEVYYPTVDVANSTMLQFIVVPAGGGRVETESEDATHRIEISDPRALSFRQINTAKDGTWKIIKTYTTDPARSTVLLDVRFEQRAPHALYVYYDPALNNSGMHDTAWSSIFDEALLAADADKASALIASTSVALNEVTNGYLGTSDGLTQLRRSGRITNLYMRAADGNVVQVARVVFQLSRPVHFTLALGFGREAEEALANARASLKKGFAAAQFEYQLGWHNYLSTLRRVAPKYQAQFDMAAMVLRAHEDKTYRGAQIASLTVPWGGGASANEPNVGGYHLVWSRDLYEVATALYAMGDKAGADRALDYLFRVQQKPDGSFPQNSWLDGRPFWGSLQMDEVAYPLILALTLGRTDNETWTKHVKPAADFLVNHGPRTPQERWEEKPGYSPSTIAAEIAGLVCAAEIARRNDAQASANIYLATADDWQRNVERWTVTSTGKHGDGNYYLRLTENDDPNDGQIVNAGNGGGDYDEREYVDAGFLELVRLGIKPPTDPLIVKSLAVVDQVLKVATPNGPCWYRYNHDGYGEMDDGRPWNFDGHYTGKGRLWALLAGERGEYELALGQSAAAQGRLDNMLGFANDGLMLPEQVWDLPTGPFKFGEGTGSATPLAWTMAQFIRLAVNLAEGRNLETPDLVAARYVKHAPPLNAGAVEEAFPDAAVLQHMPAGTTFSVRGHQPARGARLFVMIGPAARELTPDAQGVVHLDVRVPEGESSIITAIVTADGATGLTRLPLRGLTPTEMQTYEQASAPSPLVAEQLKKTEHSPLVDDQGVTFVYRGAAQRVEVVGDFTGWTPRGLFMQDLPGTNVKYLRRTFNHAARVEYKLIADGEWSNDPLNPQKIDNGVGSFNNFFTMPGYRPAGDSQWELQGTLESLAVPTRLLDGGRRKIQVYLPPDYKHGNDAYPVLYLQDGSEYVQRARAALIADQLIAQKQLKPFLIVFVDPVERMREYWLNDRFAEFMATELVPFIDQRYRTARDRNARALLGASLGGEISYWIGLKYPNLFARIGGQSCSFWIENEREVAALAALPQFDARQPLRFYLDTGLLEPTWQVSRRVRVLLAGKGYPIAYHEQEAGHNWTSWRDQLAAAYLALWRD